jgi:hypothetical protein
MRDAIGVARVDLERLAEDAAHCASRHVLAQDRDVGDERMDVAVDQRIVPAGDLGAAGRGGLFSDGSHGKSS